MKKLKRVLIANRSEIAVRVIRAARDLGIESVAVYSDADEGALHVRLADKRIALGGSSAKDTYLNRDKIINAAIQSGADCVHPGYGFFAENSDFASAVKAAGLTLIGPSPEAIALMGDKDQARKIAEKHGVPIVPGSPTGSSAPMDPKQLRALAEKIGYPVMIKAVAGGSGRGIRVAEKAEELESKIAEVEREALAAFGNKDIILEKFIVKPRHIEVQVFGDAQGNVVHFCERECSLQRRHQKVVEEAPAPNLDPELRERICKAAVVMAQAVDYVGAGTVEFLVETAPENKAASKAGKADAKSNFYFLEMNTRIQVEHPVTEMVTGVDLVKLQFLVAMGEKIGLSQKEIKSTGHAIEFRVNAENPRENWSPTAGKILYVSRAGGPGVREDGWIELGTRVSTFYDSLLSKIIVYGETRDEALTRARRCLDEYAVEGLETTLGFHRWVLKQPAFIEGQVDVKWIEREYKGEIVPASSVGPFELPPELSK